MITCIGVLIFFILTSTVAFSSIDPYVVEYMFYANLFITTILISLNARGQPALLNIENQTDYTFPTLLAAVSNGFCTWLYDVWWCANELSMFTGITLFVSGISIFILSLEVSKIAEEGRFYFANYALFVRGGIILAGVVMAVAIGYLISATWFAGICTEFPF